MTPTTSTRQPATAASAPPAPEPKAWRKVRLAATLALGLGLIAWLLWQVNPRELWRALSQVSFPLLALGILGNLLTPALRAERFRHLYQVVDKRREITGILGQYGLLNMLLPLRSGDLAILGVLTVRRVIPTLAEALPRWIVMRAADLLTVLTLVLLTALFVPFHAELDQWMWAARLGALGICLASVAGIYWMRRMPSARETAPDGFLAGRVWAFRRGLAGLDRTGTLLTLLAWSFVIWAWHALLLAIEYAAFGLPLAAPQLWAIGVAILAISILPIHAPLAIGTMHALQVGLLRLFDIPLPLALATAIGIHAAMVVTVAAQGFLGTLLLAKVDWRPT